MLWSVKLVLNFYRTVWNLQNWKCEAILFWTTSATPLSTLWVSNRKEGWGFNCHFLCKVKLWRYDSSRIIICFKILNISWIDLVNRYSKKFIESLTSFLYCGIVDKRIATRYFHCYKFMNNFGTIASQNISEQWNQWVPLKSSNCYMWTGLKKLELKAFFTYDQWSAARWKWSTHLTHITPRFWGKLRIKAS